LVNSPPPSSPKVTRSPKPGRRSAKRPPGPPNPAAQSLRKLLKAGPMACILVSLGGLGVGVWADRQMTQLDQSLPDSTQVTTFARPGTITIKAADGTILQEIGPLTHEELKLSQMPEGLVNAFLAAEDHRFYEHNGVDFQGIARAVGVNLMQGAVVEGASTITQQLARMVFLTQAPTLERKLREARLAQKIEQEMVKNDVLEYYLNLVYLGSGAYGVGDAAWVFFSKSVDQLTLPEMATIAGMPAAPSEYSPIVSPELARRRRNLILDRMADLKFITPEEAEEAKASLLGTNPSVPKRLNVRLPYFTSYIEQELPKFVSAEEIEKGGLIVETTLDIKMQGYAEKAVTEALDTSGVWQNFANAALVSIDPRSGEIRAMVGGRDFKENQFNFATQAKRQPGSTFKGLVYTAAIASGMSPTDSYEDKPIKIGNYEPKNANGRNVGSVSLDTALTQSINTVAIQVLGDVGFEPTIALAKDMGIESKLEAVYALALGAYEVTLLEMTSAYGTLANNGQHQTAHGIRKIRNQAGDILYDYSTEGKPRQAVDADSAAIMTWMLRHVVTSGTGTPAQLPDRPVAGKTGTTDNARDLWFIGYIPQLVTGVWLGNKDNTPTYGASTTAAGVWHDFAVKATEGMEVIDFPELPSFSYREASIERKPAGQEIKGGSSRNAENAANPENNTNSSYSNTWTNPDRYDYVQSGAGAGYVNSSYGTQPAESSGGGGGGGSAPASSYSSDYGSTPIESSYGAGNDSGAAPNSGDGSGYSGSGSEEPAIDPGSAMPAPEVPAMLLPAPEAAAGPSE
jgi:penicillin-binding protein 1A